MNDPTPPPAPYNPYLAPQHDAPPPRAAANTAFAAGAPIKWLYFAATAAIPLNVVFCIVFMALGLPQESVNHVEGSLQQLIGLAHMVLALAWIYTVWKALPDERRGGTTPVGAALSFFVPVYNLVWMFQMNISLCGALDGMLIERGMPTQAPRTLAVVAPIVHLASSLMAFIAFAAQAPLLALAGSLSAEVLWTIYMFRVDRVRTMLAFA